MIIRAGFGILSMNPGFQKKNKCNHGNSGSFIALNWVHFDPFSMPRCHKPSNQPRSYRVVKFLPCYHSHQMLFKRSVVVWRTWKHGGRRPQRPPRLDILAILDCTYAKMASRRTGRPGT